MTDNDSGGDSTSRNDRDKTGQTNRTDDTGGTDGTISTDRLFGGRDEILIRHGNDTYRLRITRAGKLILNK
ncbi:MAG: hemin uptake protein HemP [Rhodopirellula sp.]|nr:hemin uptake protein HemP [Rhodopirellula sp.]